MKTILTFVITLLLGFTSYAQTLENPGTPEERATKITQQMHTAMQLDSLQLPKVEALNLKYAQIAQKEIIDKNLGKMLMFRKGTQLNLQKEQELKLILNPTQWMAYQELKRKNAKKILDSLF